jgi:hypothetical protein
MTTLLVFGASGVVGGAVVDQALQDPRISAIRAVTRRRLTRSEPPLQSLLHEDFRNFDALADALRGVDACVYALGSGHGAGRDSRQTWARIKAETEDAVTQIVGANARIFRPGYIYPVRGRETPYWGDAVMRPFMLFRNRLAKYITDSETVARALVHVALGAEIPSPASNADIRKAATDYLARASAV